MNNLFRNVMGLAIMACCVVIAADGNKPYTKGPNSLSPKAISIEENVVPADNKESRVTKENTIEKSFEWPAVSDDKASYYENLRFY